MASQRQPGPLPENHTEYTIVPGDTMWQIAISSGLTLNELTASNPHLEKDPFHPRGDPWHWIYPGEIVHIPPVPDRSAVAPADAGAAGEEDITAELALSVVLTKTELRGLELAAHATGEPVGAFAREAMLARIASLRKDEEFRRRVEALIEADRKILDRLRSGD